MAKQMIFKKVCGCGIWLWVAIALGGCAGPQSSSRRDAGAVKQPEKSVVSPAPETARKGLDISKDEEKARADAKKESASREIAFEKPTPEVRKETPIVPPSEPPKAGPRPFKPPAQKASSEKKGPKIALNFDNADLYAVISTIAELLGLNYIVDPNVTGKVTINTAGSVYKEDLFPVFLQILEVNGLTAIQERGVYRIVQMKESARLPIEMRLSDQPDDTPPMEKIVIQVIPLQFISAEEMVKLLTPFVSAGGTIVSDKASNTLLVVDKGANVLKVLRLVEAFDVNMLQKVSYKVYPIKYLDVEQVSKTLDDFSSSYGEVSNVFVKFIPITQLNTLFVVSTSPLVFQKVDEIIRQIDVIDTAVAPKVYVYFVKNGEAVDLAKLLESVFLNKPYKKETKTATKTDTKKRAGGSAAVTRNPFSQSAVQQKKAEEAAAAKAKAEAAAAAARAKSEPSGDKTAGAESGGTGSGTLLGEIRITPDETRNALIIKATPPDYRVIENVLHQIDVLPRQVLIEATIAEITVNTSDQIGTEWAFGQGAAQGTASFAATINKMVVGTGADAAASGLKYSIGVTDKWYAALHALASEGKVNVLSSPHVLASDNKEAKIDVSREIPVASGTTTIASSTVIGETAIQYRDTGVILSVTPHINERGLVTMDISEEVSDLEKQSVEVAGEKYPAFFKRTINTSLTVSHGQTIAIGGLIKDKEDEGITGVPCLIKIPVLRYMFGDWSKDVEKIELIVLITPRVVANLDDVDKVTDEFKQKAKNVMRRFYPEG